ncbi:hypothetical protein IEQ34_005293 [Dendrobium chrysotoxum]|uniref:N-acetyltransferase domain-containing protein n=1 Tax=Dendrobium chrysotoxum TaxID=161865 RepID=A0AAV7HAP0_DENCH|nr:hypothetical protein IEQ34_005293 [Dendrobium chrysotoxum]
MKNEGYKAHLDLLVGSLDYQRRGFGFESYNHFHMLQKIKVSFRMTKDEHHLFISNNLLTIHTFDFLTLIGKLKILFEIFFFIIFFKFSKKMTKNIWTKNNKKTVLNQAKIKHKISIDFTLGFFTSSLGMTTLSTPFFIDAFA